MADSTQNGHTEWSAADFDELNRAVGMLGPQAVELIPGKPPITLDLSGAALLTALGKWGNPLMREKARALSETADALGASVADASADAPLAGTSLEALEKAAQANLEYFDCVLQAVLIAPPYQSLESLRRDGPKPGHLHVLAFSQEQRSAVQALVVGGVEALARFRADPAGFVAGFAVSGLPPEPSAGTPPAPAPSSGDVAERSDLAPGDRLGGRAARSGRPRDLARPSDGALTPEPPAAETATGAA